MENRLASLDQTWGNKKENLFHAWSINYEKYITG